MGGGDYLLFDGPRTRVPLTSPIKKVTHPLRPASQRVHVSVECGTSALPGRPRPRASYLSISSFHIFMLQTVRVYHLFYEMPKMGSHSFNGAVSSRRCTRSGRFYTALTTIAKSRNDDGSNRRRTSAENKPYFRNDKVYFVKITAGPGTRPGEPAARAPGRGPSLWRLLGPRVPETAKIEPAKSELNKKIGE
ncbi:hypothetical protein EVAR_3196_1 [Eumeta japonica]|uniref:Uncharacterized protein n=1 Tax=Eumeta variegata TaxID=151549 RepID=A0A4C1SY23_EUMVA|nr:hypothetical protein EVAR_3196_1 [Eumeta japonica]